MPNDPAAPQQWRRLEALFQIAVEMDDRHERAAFVERACAGDEQLRRNVERLLSADEKADDFLATPALESALRIAREEGTTADSLAVPEFESPGGILEQVVQEALAEPAVMPSHPPQVAAAGPRPPVLQEGDQLGPYRIGKLLGQGGMGRVYRAVDTRFETPGRPELQRVVALKVVDNGFSAAFEREARFIAALRHPQICLLHDVGEAGNTSFVVMEYIEGITLADRLRQGPMPVLEGLDIGRQLADTLDYVHGQGIVHGDLKPSNVMITSVGIKLLDFGIARLFDAVPEGLAEGVLASPAYMSPEQIGANALDVRTDVFSFGSVLYEMFSGMSAFRRAGELPTMIAVQYVDPPLLSDVDPAIPRELARVVARCLRKAPEDRYAAMRDVKIALEAVTRSLAAPNPERFSGEWKAEFADSWGTHCEETFVFVVDGKTVTGTATYRQIPRGMVKGKIDGDRIKFITKYSVTHYDYETFRFRHEYTGQLAEDGIRFVLQTQCNFESRAPVFFTAHRAADQPQ